MTSRSWQYISCPWDACPNHFATRDSWPKVVISTENTMNAVIFFFICRSFAETWIQPYEYKQSHFFKSKLCRGILQMEECSTSWASVSMKNTNLHFVTSKCAAQRESTDSLVSLIVQSFPSLTSHFSQSRRNKTQIRRDLPNWSCPKIYPFQSSFCGLVNSAWIWVLLVIF